jgi:hypothetical protein
MVHGDPNGHPCLSVKYHLKAKVALESFLDSNSIGKKTYQRKKKATMISMIMILNQKGDIMISRQYRCVFDSSTPRMLLAAANIVFFALSFFK